MRHRSFLAAFLPVLIAMTSACGGVSARPLTHTHTSPQALASAVLEAVERRDGETLRKLALNEADFHDYVWPSLPASRPERNLPFSYVWGDLRQKSEHSLAAMLAAHGGRRYTLVDVDFEQPPSRFDTFNAHRRTTLTVRNDAATLLTLRLYGSTFENAGAFKVFSYVVE